MGLIWQTSPTSTRPWVSVSLTQFLKNLCSFPKTVDIILPLINLWSLLLLFSCLVMSDSLPPHGLQLGRLPCPSPTPEACSNSCPLSWWCHPTISSSVIPFSLPSIFPSIRVFSNELALHIRWPKYWSFSFNISPSNEYSGLISFRIYWFDLLAVQEILKSLLQHHSLKVSTLWYSPFFMVPLSHLYVTTRKTIALTVPSGGTRRPVTLSLIMNCLSLFFGSLGRP